MSMLAALASDHYDLYGRRVDLTAQTPIVSTVHHPFGSPSGPGLFRVKGLQLPAYIQNVAHALIRTGAAATESRAIEMAVGIVKNWAHGHDGHGHRVHPDVQAAATKALAEWMKDRAIAHSHERVTAGDIAIDLLRMSSAEQEGSRRGGQEKLAKRAGRGGSRTTPLDDGHRGGELVETAYYRESDFIRHVRTPAGVKYYHLPIGSPITPHAAAAAKVAHAAAKAVTPVSSAGPVKSAITFKVDKTPKGFRLHHFKNGEHAGSTFHKTPEAVASQKKRIRGIYREMDKQANEERKEKLPDLEKHEINAPNVPDTANAPINNAPSKPNKTNKLKAPNKPKPSGGSHVARPSKVVPPQKNKPAKHKKPQLRTAKTPKSPNDFKTITTGTKHHFRHFGRAKTEKDVQAVADEIQRTNSHDLDNIAKRLERLEQGGLLGKTIDDIIGEVNKDPDLPNVVKDSLDKRLEQLRIDAIKEESAKAKRKAMVALGAMLLSLVFTVILPGVGAAIPAGLLLLTDRMPEIGKIVGDYRVEHPSKHKLLKEAAKAEKLGLKAPKPTSVSEILSPHKKKGKAKMVARSSKQVGLSRDFAKAGTKPKPSFKTLPVGTRVSWKYRSGTGHGTVAGVHKLGTSHANTEYTLHVDAADLKAHKGEPPIRYHYGSDITVAQDHSTGGAKMSASIQLYNVRGQRVEVDLAASKSKPKGKHIGFDKLVANLQSKGHSLESAQRIAHYVGVRKYGKKGFKKLVSAGMH